MLEAVAEPVFVKPTVTFVAVPGFVGLGEIVSRERWEADAGRAGRAR
jgi:hypothetical protein